MKILAIADVESKSLWEHYRKERLEGIDLIVSAGDLDPEYLSFLTTLSSIPVIYVPGNHDKYDKKPPEGCICVDSDIYTYNGVRILGLGGSMKYKRGKNQYTEKEMRRRVASLWFKLLKNKGFDILLTHAPAKDFHDGEDLPHNGFETFNRLIRKYSPAYHIHGHMHESYSHNFVRVDKNMDTTVINACEKYVIEI